MKANILIASVLMMSCAVPQPESQPASRPKRSPKTLWLVERNNLNQLNIRFIEASKDDTITNDQRVRWGEILQAARKALQLAEELLPDGGEEFDKYLCVARSFMAKLSAFEQLKEKL